MRRNQPPARAGWSSSTSRPGVRTSTSSNTTSRRVARRPETGVSRRRRGAFWPGRRNLSRISFLQAGFRAWHHGQDQVQHRVVETGVGEGQGVHIPLQGRETVRRQPGQSFLQHGPGQVQAHVLMLGRQPGGVQAGTQARQQHPARGRRQMGEAVLAQGAGGPLHQGVVQGREAAVGEAQAHGAQCRVRGMASTNSGISASKGLPSSATIW